MSRTKNVLNNFFYGIIQKFVMMLGPFCVRTTLIYQLSSDIAGINDLFVSILQILNLTELGLSNVIVYSMYKPIAENNTKALCSLLNFYRKAYLYVGGIIFTVGIIILPFVLYLFKDNNTQNINVILVYLIFLINSSVSYLFWSYKTCLLTANQRQDIISRNTAIVNLILCVIQIAILYCFKNYYIYVCVLPFSTIALNVFNYKIATKLYPEIKCKGKICKDEFQQIKKSLYGIVIWKIGSISRNSFDSIVITCYLGMTMVAIYNNYMLVLNAITGFFGILVNSILSSVGNKIVSNSVEENYNDFCKFNLIYMMFSSWITVCLLCLYQPFMTFWMGGNLLLSQISVSLLCFYFFLLRSGDICSVYYQASGLWYKGKYRSLVEAVLNLIFNIILGYYFEIEGIILATIISLCCLWFYGVNILFKNYFKNYSVIKFCLESFYYAFITIITCMCAYYFCNVLSIGKDNEKLVIVFILRLIICVSFIAFLLFFYKKLSNYCKSLEFARSVLVNHIFKRKC